MVSWKCKHDCHEHWKCWKGIFVPCVSDQESHLSIRDRLRSNDKIAFIFAILRIENNYELAIFCCMARLISDRPARGGVLGFLFEFALERRKREAKKGEMQKNAYSLKAPIVSSIESN